jgi:hypothetical protein
MLHAAVLTLAQFCAGIHKMQAHGTTGEHKTAARELFGERTNQPDCEARSS